MSPCRTTMSRLASSPRSAPLRPRRRALRRRQVVAVPDDHRRGDPHRPGATGDLDQAPVTVAITNASVSNAFVVPVDALLALSSGGYALEVIGSKPGATNSRLSTSGSSTTPMASCRSRVLVWQSARRSWCRTRETGYLKRHRERRKAEPRRRRLDGAGHRGALTRRCP